jgi:hypothetical protein
MAHAQKTDLVFRRNGRVHLNCQGVSVQSTTGGRGVRISGSNAGYTTFRGSVKSTGYPLQSPVSPSLPLPCVTVCHHISTGVYYWPNIETVRMCEDVENLWNNNGWQYFIWAAPNVRAVWGVGLRLRACWDCGFESHSVHRRFSVVSGVCWQVEVSATNWSLVRRSPTDCGASLCVI